MEHVNLIVNVAMDEEADPFINGADSVREVEKTYRGAARWWRLSSGPSEILLIRSGIGLVASASAVARAVDAWTCQGVIAAGTCGGIGENVSAGDIVVGSRYIFSGADARPFGYALEQVPGQPQCFVADETLVKAAKTLGKIMVGPVLSADIFVSAEKAKQCRADFPGAIAVDMESAAIAYVCSDSAIPFISLRGISDLCGPSANVDFDEHVDDAATRSCRAVFSLASKLAGIRENG